MTRYLHSIDEIKHLLVERCSDVAYRYAPPVAESYEEKNQYWTLNPGRFDRSVGSFVVHLGGQRKGRWYDFAMKQGGDLLDLIQMHLRCDTVGALREARIYLGIEHEAPADRERRARALEKAKRDAIASKAQIKKDRERNARLGQGCWRSGQELLRGTPAEAYLLKRGINLAALGRQPRALRFVPECFWQEFDKNAGTMRRAKLPALVSLVSHIRHGVLGCHRIYLGRNPAGQWDKAPVIKPKKVLGDPTGGLINISSGIGPRGGKAVRLSQCPPETHLYLTEGVEDALTVMMIAPEVRVSAAVTLGNLSAVELPENVSKVTIVGDKDPSDEAQAALDAALVFHQQQGRRVALWQNHEGGKDINDAWLNSLAERSAS